MYTYICIDPYTLYTFTENLQLASARRKRITDTTKHGIICRMQSPFLAPLNNSNIFVLPEDAVPCLILLLINLYLQCATTL